MKKLIRVRIQRNQTANLVSYKYPSKYDETKIQVICYENQITGKMADINNRGNVDEYLIGVVEDIYLNSFVDGIDIVEITRNQAEQFVDQDLDTKYSRVIDQKKVLLILAKAALDEKLTKEDKDVLDPKNTESGGIIETKSYKERFDQYGV